MDDANMNIIGIYFFLRIINLHCLITGICITDAAAFKKLI